MADRRKKIRLDDREAYASWNNIFHITICTLRGARPFEKAELALSAIEVLKREAALMAVRIFAYCFMPDHVHFVIGPGPECAVDVFVDRYKSLAARASWKHGVHRTYWQERHFDRQIRLAEGSVAERSMYVLGNPVRAGLVERWQDYPYSGSLEWEGIRE